jgi:hypothetical protein
MNCSNEIEWGYYAANVFKNDCTIFYNQGAQLILDAEFSLNQRLYKRALDSVKEDGGSHVPAQTDVTVRRTCSRCQLCEICDCSKKFLRFPSKSSAQVSWVNKMNNKTLTKHSNVYHEAIITSRYDDHNPFFHLSLLMNAWSIRNRLSFNHTTVMVLGEKIVQNLDNLWSSLFRANVLYTEDLPDKFFVKRAWFVRSEYRSPIMRELDSTYLSCNRRSNMIKSFFSDAVNALSASNKMQEQITFIKREFYKVKGKSRQIGRRLLNEDKIIEATQNLFPDIKINQVLMENLSQREQVAIMQKSKVVIGMHGAGMVNVGFMHPGATVIEIFPKFKRRYGYRNLCAYLGIKYHEYRGGIDNRNMDKTLNANEWEKYVRGKIDV